MSSFPAAVPSQNGWVSSSRVGRSKRMGAVMGNLTLASAGVGVLLHLLRRPAGGLSLVEPVAERVHPRESGEAALLLGRLAEREERLEGLVEIAGRESERVGPRALLRRSGHERGRPRAGEAGLLELRLVGVAVDAALLLGRHGELV